MIETSFKELTFSLLGLIADGTSLSESVVWNMFAKHKSLQEVKTESDLFSLRNDVVNYREKLHFYISQESYHNDASITNKFFADVVSTVRQRAEKSINILQRVADKTIDKNEKQLLLDDIEMLKTTVNLYLETVRDILENNDFLQNHLNLIGVDFVEKYNLQDL